MNGVRKIMYLFALLSVFIACQDDDDNDKLTKEEELTLRANQFIHDNMSMFYLWNKEMPAIDPQKEKDPIEYFEKLLSSKDSASIITDDAQGLMESLTNTGETFGYDLAYFGIADNKYCAVIKYVYPNTPAATANLKRGDLIVKINSAYITKDNADELNQNGTIQLTKAKLEGNYLIETNAVTLTSKKMETDPVLIRKVIEKGNHKIGYLMYTDFASSFNNSLEDAFNYFKTEGITDLVLDLRYNHGGDDAASALMCSAIAPPDKAIEGELLSYEKWNSECQKAFESDSRFDTQLHRYFKKVDCNLNLPNKRVYILTTRETISASEYTAICLEPFMKVIRIGQKTYGKFTTMALMQPTKEDTNGKIVADEELSNWLMAPIVSRYTNVDGYPSDAVKGLEPNYKVEDQLLPPASTLGAENEPLLAKAIAIITGENKLSPRSALQSTPDFKQIHRTFNDIRSNRIIIKNNKLCP
ncbi:MULTISPECIES: S41 family peptidase [Butyricimonas]|uniref:S41 family peptidase n=1 Tax=Butyricimonas TaxID=574697 RepID=UPI001D092633|nr:MULTISPECIES: S41 family peptidase [Butyricimonas]MCB6971515.1 hypothetical protein [Butyricimonas synergistica]MCG4518229.1 S41 family peptidase [Butyricimonas sp. DFI.6.44]